MVVYCTEQKQSYRSPVLLMMSSNLFVKEVTSASSTLYQSIKVERMKREADVRSRKVKKETCSFP